MSEHDGVRRRLGGVLIAFALVMVGGGVWVQVDGARTDIEDSAPAVDMAGNQVRLEGEPPSPRQIEAMAAEPGSVDRFILPSAGLDVPIGEISEADGVITPPDFTQVYRVRNRGVDLAHADAGTVFIVMHSLADGGKAPGNFLADAETGSARIEAGAEITAAGVRYRVTGTELIDKPALASRADIWDDISNRLVVITCMQRTEGRSRQNLVVVAMRVP